MDDSAIVVNILLTVIQAFCNFYQGNIYLYQTAESNNIAWKSYPLQGVIRCVTKMRYNYTHQLTFAKQMYIQSYSYILKILRQLIFRTRFTHQYLQFISILRPDGVIWTWKIIWIWRCLRQTGIYIFGLILLAVSGLIWFEWPAKKPFEVVVLVIVVVGGGGAKLLYRCDTGM